MINLKQIYSKLQKVPNLLSESKMSHLKHLFEDGTLSFDDMRGIFNKVFTGKVGINTNIERTPLLLTYKDGKFVLAKNSQDDEQPFSDTVVCKRCNCNSGNKQLVVTAINNFMKPLSKLSEEELEPIFKNGKRCLSLDVIIPAKEQLSDYGNRCFLQFNNVGKYDNNTNTIVEDEPQRTEECGFDIGNYIRNNKCIDNSIELDDDKIQHLKNSTSPDTALKGLLSKLAQIVDGIGYKATVNDYVRERYAKHIVNTALKYGIDLYRNSDFVNELISRLSYVSDHRPNRGDLITYAKRDRVDWRSPQYREFIADLESTADQTNDEIVKPIELLVLEAGILLMKCFLGIVVSDPRRQAKKLVSELDNTIQMLENDADGLTPEKIKTFRHCMKNLDQYQKTLPEDGILIMHNGKICKIKGRFGAINDISRMMNY